MREKLLLQVNTNLSEDVPAKGFCGNCSHTELRYLAMGFYYTPFATVYTIYFRNVYRIQVQVGKNNLRERCSSSVTRRLYYYCCCISVNKLILCIHNVRMYLYNNPLNLIFFVTHKQLLVEISRRKDFGDIGLFYDPYNAYE